MDDFYVVLPSNAEKDNTASKFTTRFERPIEFANEQNWEVALVEVNFKNTIKSIVKGDRLVIAKYVRTSKEAKKNQTFQYTSEFRTHEVKSKKVIESVAAIETEQHLNVEISDDKTVLKHEDFDIKYEVGIMRIINKTDYNGKLTINKYIAQVLGFLDNVNMNPKDKTLTTITIFGDVTDAYYPPKLKNNKVNFGPIKKIPSFDIEFDEKTRIDTITTFNPDPGSYASADELIKHLNSDKTIKKYVEFKHNLQLNRCEIIPKVKDKDYFLVLDNGLDDVLGFKDNGYHFDSNHVGDLEITLLRGINSVFIYCDCCEPIRIGNTLAPLLRTVSFPATKYGEMINKNYQNPMYVSVSKNFIDSISILLCDAIGQNVPFAEGMTTCILHFRRK